MQKLIFLFYLLMCVGIAQELTATRFFTSAWQDAGYSDPHDKKGVSVFDFGAIGDGKTNDTAALKKAISWIQNNTHTAITVLYFPRGKYLITETIRLPQNIILRGEHSQNKNHSALLFDFAGKNGSCVEISGKAHAFQPVVGNISIHEYAIEVSDVSAFTVGDYAEIEQKNDSRWDNNDTWCTHAIGQIVEIAKIDGNFLHVKKALRANYQQQYQPRIRKISPKKHVGIENLILKRIDTKTPIYGNHISFKYAADCWVSGVKFLNCVQRFVDMHHSTHIQISGCYFKDAFAYNGGGHAYGCEASFHTGECLITNNVFEHLRHSMLVQAGGNGNVFSYNYSRTPHRSEWPHDYASDLCLHGNYPFANLFEGNVVYNAQIDNSHGISGHLNTLFRNSVGHYGFIMTSNTDKQNILANDITDSNVGHGLFVIFGNDHEVKGNRQANVWQKYKIVPKNSSISTKSLYLDTPPDFWDKSIPWPNIGINSKTDFAAKLLPARKRFLQRNVYTVGLERNVTLIKVHNQ